MSPEIQPCPWCGAKELNFRDGETHRWGLAECASCGASAGEVRRAYPPDNAWHETAIVAWNTRAAQPAIPRFTDGQIDRIFEANGGRWQGDYFRIEDADFYPFARALIASVLSAALDGGEKGAA